MMPCHENKIFSLETGTTLLANLFARAKNCRLTQVANYGQAGVKNSGPLIYLIPKVKTNYQVRKC